VIGTSLKYSVFHFIALEWEEGFILKIRKKNVPKTPSQGGEKNIERRSKKLHKGSTIDL
jgi:hypothetical protein